MNILKTLSALSLSFHLAFGQTTMSIIDEKQLFSLAESRQEALKFKVRTGLSFENTVGCMQLVESTAGKQIIGDTILQGKNVDLFLSSLGPLQAQPITSRWMIKTDPWLRARYSYFLRDPKWADKDYKQVYLNYKRYFKLYMKYEGIINNPKWRDGKSRKAKDTIIWATRMRDTYKEAYEKYMPEIKRDQALVNKLLSDVRFGTQIALAHLAHYYIHAKKIGIRNPYFRTISRYNGGHNNKPYYRRVLSKMKFIKRLVKEGLLLDTIVVPEGRYLSIGYD